MIMTASEVQRRMKLAEPAERAVKDIITAHMDRLLDAWLTTNRAALWRLSPDLGEKESDDGRLDHI